MGVAKVDFGDPLGAAQEVNTWVKEQNSAAVQVMDCSKVRDAYLMSFNAYMLKYVQGDSDGRVPRLG